MTQIQLHYYKRLFFRNSLKPFKLVFEVLRLLQNQVCTNRAASGNRGRKRNQGITMI